MIPENSNVSRLLRLLVMLAIAITITSADQHDNKVDLGATVQEVEAMLAKDPRLPRLTRGEILKLIDEVRTGKDVVVVLPDNTSTGDYTGSSTTVKPKRPIKRRRKKPSTVRPVYVHSTTVGETTSNSSVASNSGIISSSTESNDWIPNSTLRPSTVRSTPKPSTKPSSESTGVLPPIPGLDSVDGINAWSSTGGKSTESSIYITPSTPAAPPVAADSLLESPPNVKVAAESLGPEMKDLLTKFGLLGETTTEKFYQGALPVPTIDPEVYSRFKPLPVKSTAESVSPDMKSFLASFGLLDSRQGKEMKPEAKSPLEYIPEYHKNILAQLGLWKDGRAIDLSALDKKNDAPKHVFNPNKLETADRKAEFEKVSKILAKLREIGEGDESKLSELSPSDIEELISLEKNTRQAAQGQIFLEDESMGFEGEKNDVKRAPQESSASSSASSSGSSSSASSSASASVVSDDQSQASASASADSDSTADESTSPSSTEEPTTTTQASSSDSVDSTERGASAVDLEASFGNGDTTTKRPNGFYFLLDWNSFLDVGLDDRAIHLNFSPKVGDPKNFLPVVIGNSQRRRR